MHTALLETTGFFADFHSLRARVESDRDTDTAAVNDALRRYYQACADFKRAHLRGERSNFPRQSDADVIQALYQEVLGNEEMVLRVARCVLWAAFKSGTPLPFPLSTCGFIDNTYQGANLCATEHPVGTYGYAQMIDAAAQALRQSGLRITFVRSEWKTAWGEVYPCTGSCPMLCDGNHRTILDRTLVRHESESLFGTGCHYQHTGDVSVEITQHNS